jgi:hypothetical protein
MIDFGQSWQRRWVAVAVFDGSERRGWREMDEMGLRVFLSYAKEDSLRVSQLKSYLNDFEVDDWQGERNAHRVSESIVESIEQGVARADAFLLFLSPHYLVSRWCRRERVLALHHEGNATADRPFIHVLKIGPVRSSELGLTRDTRQIDLTDENAATRMSQLVEHLKLSGSETVTRDRVIGLIPSFRNRDDELRTVLGALTTSQDNQFWSVVAPPQQGKSWFLDQLGACLPHEWTIKLLDLQKESIDTHSNVENILSRLFDIDTQKLAAEDWARQIAQKILNGGVPHLCMIDGGEKLDSGVAESLRKRFSEISLEVDRGHLTGMRMGLVIATRTMKPEWDGVHPKPMMTAKHLSEFSFDVVRNAIKELAEACRRMFGKEEIDRIAADAYDLSAGMPQLLREIMTWLKDSQWLSRGELSSQDLFRQISSPFVLDKLLSSESLSPFGGSGIAARREVLVHAFQTLAPYRRFTHSHLKHALDEDVVFGRMLGGLDWTAELLLDRLAETSLVIQDGSWFTVVPAVQRLLFSHYYFTESERTEAHLSARNFYDQWGLENDPGGERITIFLESLWHEASRRSLDGTFQQVDEVVQCTHDRAIALSIHKNPVLGDAQQRRVVGDRLRKDTELQQLLRRVPNLFEAVHDAIIPGQSRQYHGAY